MRLQTSQSDNSGGRVGDRGDRQPSRKERSTWGGSEKRSQRRRVKGLTETETGSCQQLGTSSSQPSLFQYMEEDRYVCVREKDMRETESRVEEGEGEEERERERGKERGREGGGECVCYE